LKKPNRKKKTKPNRENRAKPGKTELNRKKTEPVGLNRCFPKITKLNQTETGQFEPVSVKKTILVTSFDKKQTENDHLYQS
jgi:hypothetical protein